MSQCKENSISINEEWMTKTFFAKVLKTNELNINKFTIEIATKKGDNYASIMYRAVINYVDSTTKCLIIKVTPPGEIRSIIMENNFLYPKEMQFYDEILPAIYKMLHSIGLNTKLSPECYFTCNEPKKLLIFEDLKDLGYVMHDRKIELTKQETLLILTKLAKFHAASVILEKQNPNIMNLYRKGNITTDPNRQDFLVFYTVNAKMLRKLAEYIGCSKEILDKLDKFIGKIIEKGVQLYTRDEESFNVFCHNDLWINNFMFKYGQSTDEIEDILFLDYQLSYWGSPGIDLNYLFYGSVNITVLKENFNSFIEVVCYLLSYFSF